MKYLTISFFTAFLILSSQAQDASVNPGINDSFEDPSPKSFVERFEKEGREVYDNREAIVQKLGLKPGMIVADVGAGTGLFTRLLAPEVGEKGKVYAVDIAQPFVTHTVMSCLARYAKGSRCRSSQSQRRRNQLRRDGRRWRVDS